MMLKKLFGSLFILCALCCIMIPHVSAGGLGSNALAVWAVASDEDAPVVDALVSIYDWTTSQLIISGYTDEDGMYTVKLTMDTYIVTVEKLNYNRASVIQFITGSTGVIIVLYENDIAWLIYIGVIAAIFVILACVYILWKYRKKKK